MTDRNVLKARINRLEDDPTVWSIVVGYLDGEYNQMVMYNRLLDNYGGVQKCVDPIVWEIDDWEKDE